MQAQFPREQSPEGSFERQEDRFRKWVESEPAAGFPVEARRYHLYVSLACPWAHRVLIVRKLKGLEEAIPVSIVDPIREDSAGWEFTGKDGSTDDLANGFRYLKEAYTASDPGYDGRVTVPVLWDTVSKTIVSNSDDDLMRMLNGVFAPLGAPDSPDLYPEPLRPGIDSLNELIYDSVNNGVYRAGFATSQVAYDDAVDNLFKTLDMLEQLLANSKFLFDSELTEADIRLFVTLIRFDAVYHHHFKCNLKRLSEYPKLFNLTRTIYNLPGIAETVDFDHIRRHYYLTHKEINPSGIVPVGPVIEWKKAARRQKKK